MYDSAKRSLAFTVAAGGLLLTGTAYSPALAVADTGTNQGPAQALDVRIGVASASRPVDAAHRGETVRAGFRASAAQAPPDPLASGASHPWRRAARTREAGSGAGAHVVSSTDFSGGMSHGDTFRIPVDLGTGPCGVGTDAAAAVGAGTAESTGTDSSCRETSEGSAPTVPGAPAPGTGGASATAVSMRDDRIASHDAVPAPIDIPARACGDGVAAKGRLHAREGRECGRTETKTRINSRTKAGTEPRIRTRTKAGTEKRAEPRIRTRNEGGIRTRTEARIGIGRHGSGSDSGLRNRSGTAVAGSFVRVAVSTCSCSHHASPPPPPGRMCHCSQPTSPNRSPSSRSPSSAPAGIPGIPGVPSGPPSPPRPPDSESVGALAHTGTDIGVALGVAGAALLGGLGLRAAARRREGE